MTNKERDDTNAIIVIVLVVFIIGFILGAIFIPSKPKIKTYHWENVPSPYLGATCWALKKEHNPQPYGVWCKEEQ